MAVTQKDIAQQLGVSRELVKFALNGGGRMRPEVRERILTEAQRMGYNSLSNAGARALVGKRHGARARTGVLAVLSPAPLFEGIPVQELPFFRPFLQGIEAEAALHDMDVILCFVQQNRLPRLIREENVDGVICMSMGHEDIQKLTGPIIAFGSSVSWAYSLAPDDAAGGALAIRHLRELGHEKIAYIGFPPDEGYSAATERFEGYRGALSKFDPSMVEATLRHPSIEAGLAGFERLWARDSSATAAFCFNDLIALGVIAGAKAAGLRVPEDFSVVGYDDVGEAYHADPALTSVRFDRFAMGRRAVQLVEQFHRDHGWHLDAASSATGHEVFAVELAERASTRNLA